MDINETTSFTHLHVHLISSVLDGFNKPSELAKRAKELGMTHIAVTDHNHLAGVVEFKNACEEEGIFPILGIETYFTKDTNILSLSADDRYKYAVNKAREDGVEVPEFVTETTKTGKTKQRKIKKTEVKDLLTPYYYDTKQYHLILLAKNQTGWNNLVKLQSEAAKKCTFNGRFLCDDELLAKYHEGLICTTACIGSITANLINKGKDEEALAQVLAWKEIFGKDFYLEIQPLAIDEQLRVNDYYMQWSDAYGIPMVATTDSHYTLKEDWHDHDVLVCIGTGKTIDDDTRMKYENEYWLRSRKEMVEGFERHLGDDDALNEWYMEHVETALNNTNYIASQIEEIKLGSDKSLFPQIDTPKGVTPEQWLESQCWQGLYKLKQEDEAIDLDAYGKRLNYELGIINKKGFAPYLHTVHEYVQWAEENNSPVGPGRGSAAGSLCLFTLGITKNVDPIKYDLLFERFLTEDRTAPPDIDLDFSDKDTVIEHLKAHYGADHVAHIGTFGTMGVKSGLKDVGRVLSIPFDVMNKITKSIDDILDIPNMKFKDLDALKDTEPSSYTAFHEMETENPELFRLARRFEGNIRSLGVHASGILVTPMPITDMFPTRTDENGLVTLWEHNALEDFGAIKFDVLGLDTLAVIQSTLQQIDKDMTMKDFYKKVDVNDRKVFDMICDKNTDAVFQFESNLFKGVVSDIQPDGINDAIAITALCRPGPLKAGMPAAYAKRKRGEEKAVEPLPGTWEFVKKTQGVICYQEQIMQISVKVAGFNTNQSDSIVRKIFAKKKKDKMEMLRRMFLYGKVNTEGPEGWEEDGKAPWYDPKAKQGTPIKGACNNGYTVEQMTKFWSDIEGFADYLFNASHAAAYSYISVLTGWLKRYYPVNFMASVLTNTKTEKVDHYIDVAGKMGIKLECPDVNKSGLNFTADKKNILFGLGKIKGIGASSIPELLAKRPFTSMEDMLERCNKKAVNKRVMEALIKSGALDDFEPEGNRYTLLNHLHELRKDKDELYDEDEYDKAAVLKFENEALSTYITYKSWWNEVKSGEKFTGKMEVIGKRETRDKRGGLMAWVTGKVNDCEIEGVVFASTYCRCSGLLDNKEVEIYGKKDDKGGCVISKITPVRNELPMAPTLRLSNLVVNI